MLTTPMFFNNDTIRFYKLNDENFCEIICCYYLQTRSEFIKVLKTSGV